MECYEFLFFFLLPFFVYSYIVRDNVWPVFLGTDASSLEPEQVSFGDDCVNYLSHQEFLQFSCPDSVWGAAIE